MKATLAAFAVSLSLVGCASNPTISQQSASQGEVTTAVSRDNFRKLTFVEAQKISFNNMPWYDPGLDQGVYWLSAVKADSEADPTYSLQFKTIRGNAFGWAFWETAYDESGAQLPVKKIGSEVQDGGITYEQIAVGLTRDFLNAHLHTGIRLRIDGQRAKKEINLPANYISAFLNKTDSTFGSK